MTLYTPSQLTRRRISIHAWELVGLNGADWCRARISDATVLDGQLGDSLQLQLLRFAHFVFRNFQAGRSLLLLSEADLPPIAKDTAGMCLIA